jgi:sulfate adenylyltransferase subunit 1 (EFTu-like GTPase family)
MKRLVVGLAVAVALAGCKAEMVEVRLSAEDINSALAGEAVTVPFAANFNVLGELDAEQRAQMDQLQAIAERYLSVDDFQMTRGQYGSAELELEGELPLITAANREDTADSAFAIFVEEVTDEPLLSAFPYSVRLGTTGTFAAMEGNMQDVNIMLAADAVQPVQFRLRADAGADLQVLAGGFQLSGESFGVRTVPIANGDSATITFKGGAYDAASGSFLIRLEQGEAAAAQQPAAARKVK